MPVAHVSMITLGVDDLAVAIDYHRATGWQLSSASVEGEVAFLVGGTVVLGLFGREDLADDARVDDIGRGPCAVALAMNLPSEAAVDEAVATAREAGATVVKPPERAPWGGYSGYVTDPDGHLWELAHNPGFPLDADGRVTLPT
jgi:predicted lactoylglutathione lyase